MTHHTHCMNGIVLFIPFVKWWWNTVAINSLSHSQLFNNVTGQQGEVHMNKYALVLILSCKAFRNIYDEYECMKISLLLRLINEHFINIPDCQLVETYFDRGNLFGGMGSLPGNLKYHSVLLNDTWFWLQSTSRSLEWHILCNSCLRNVMKDVIYCILLLTSKIDWNLITVQ